MGKRKISNSVPNDKSDYYRTRIYDWRLADKNTLWHPPTDVFETKDNITVIMEIAGMDVEDFDISYNESILSIRGNRKKQIKCQSFDQIEIIYGPFLSEVTLQKPVNEKEISVEYQSGFLKISLPKIV